MIHELKTQADVFARLLDGTKTFEVRCDDRHFQAGDTVVLKELRRGPFANLGNNVTGAELTYRIGFVLRGSQYGIQDGYVVFSLLRDAGSAGLEADHG